MGRTALRWLCRGGLAVLGLLAGCYWKESRFTAEYGIDLPLHDPTVQLTDFSYTPASPVQPGDTLVFTVNTSNPLYRIDSSVEVRIGSNEHPVAGVAGGVLTQRCRDDGIAPDAAAHDGVNTGQITIPDSVQPQSGLPVSTWLSWFDGHNTPELAGPPLDIEKGEQQ